MIKQTGNVGVGGWMKRKKGKKDICRLAACLLREPCGGFRRAVFGPPLALVASVHVQVRIETILYILLIIKREHLAAILQLYFLPVAYFSP